MSSSYRSSISLPNKKIKCRQKVLDLSRPKVMGILNVTPDSFSDGGRYANVDLAIAHCESMLNDGAHIIDIGGESTRPNASPVDTATELERVVPVVMAIREHFGDDIWLSIDTSNPEVMRTAIEAGADIINDVRALRRTGAMQMAATLDVPVVLMHSRGEPDTMNQLADYTDIIDDVMNELGQSIDAAIMAGVRRENLIIDVGMGFAKDFEHHKMLLKHLDRFINELDLPMLFGVSRKRFLGELLMRSGIVNAHEHQPTDRDGVGAGLAMLAVMAGASIVRVHDVLGVAQMLSAYEQIYLD